MKRICLILDNPLRDLDGLCLIAWHLAQAGAEVFLVPMHNQGFDIPCLKPDVVLANYVRPNNHELLKLYNRLGIRVAVLDTEGVGSWWPKHAERLRNQNARFVVDQYYCWGKAQAKGLLEAQSFEPHQLVVTGCPRYDFASEVWRPALPKNDVAPGYILINTNFPVVNPQFTKDTSSEIRSWVKVGWGSQSQATAFAHASQLLFEDIKKSVCAIARALPEQTFILRPHPFESIAPYEKIARSLPNLLLRKEGTSLQWINQAIALLHINCFTSVEAGLMKTEALAFEWLNRAEIRNYSNEPFIVSRNATNFEELVFWLKELTLRDKNLSPMPERENALRALVDANYHAIDGQSCSRVANAIMGLTNAPSRYRNSHMPKLRMRQYLVHNMRNLLGYKRMSFLKTLSTPLSVRREQAAKIPSAEMVGDVLRRIQSITGALQRPHVRQVSISDCDISHRSSMTSLRIVVE